MANGDLAASKGIASVPSTANRSLGYDELNLTHDLVVLWATRHGPEIDVYVQASAPAHKAGRVWIKTT